MSIREVEVIESERYFPFVGWGQRRLPTDRPAFSDSTGKVPLKALHDVDGMIPPICRWTSDWVKQNDPMRFDPDGWEYALDFVQPFHPRSTATSCVRRRHWRRVLEIPVNEATARVFEVTFSPEVQRLLLEDDGFDEVMESEIAFDDTINDIADKKAKHTPAQERVLHKATQCVQCSKTFSVVRWKWLCVSCERVYCRDCCHVQREYKRARVCQRCVEQHEKDREAAATAEQARREAEIQRKASLYQIKMAIEATTALEVSGRAALFEDETAERAALRESLVAECAAAAAREEEDRKKHADEYRRGQICDKWAAFEGPRSGHIHIRVERAVDLTDGDHVSSRVTVTVHGVKKISPTRHDTRHPEFEFESDFIVSDDTEPVTFLLEFHEGGIWRSLAEASLDLRAPYPNMTRHVSPGSELYTESGYCIVAAKPFGSKRRPPPPSVHVHWTLEVRDQDTTHVDFCEGCGRVEASCVCPRADRARRASVKEEKDRQMRLRAQELRWQRLQKEKEAWEAKQATIHKDQRLQLALDWRQGLPDLAAEEVDAFVELNKAFVRDLADVAAKDARRSQLLLLLQAVTGQAEDAERRITRTCLYKWHIYARERHMQKKVYRLNEAVQREERDLREAAAAQREAVQRDTARRKQQRDMTIKSATTTTPTTAVTVDFPQHGTASKGAKSNSTAEEGCPADTGNEKEPKQRAGCACIVS